jgi:hypothetical protein
MITEVVIRLKDGKTLMDAALEVQALNQYAGTPDFPRPVPCNPESAIPEGFLGLVNTPPDADGFVVVRIEYDYFDLGKLPAPPQTFSFVFGRTPATGAIAS